MPRHYRDWRDMPREPGSIERYGGSAGREPRVFRPVGRPRGAREEYGYEEEHGAGGGMGVGGQPPGRGATYEQEYGHEDRYLSYGREFSGPYGGLHELEYDEYGYEFGGRGRPYEETPYGLAGRWPEDVPGHTGEHWPPYGEGQGYGRRRGRSWRGPDYRAGHPFGPGRARGEPFARGREPRYGHSPSDRWPSETHYAPRPEYERGMRDGEIRDAVYEHLFRDTWVDPARIGVEVRDGVVMLRGEVNDFMEARYIWDDAWESPGVRGVINNLTVRTDAPHEGARMPQTGGRSRGSRR